MAEFHSPKRERTRSRIAAKSAGTKGDGTVGGGEQPSFKFGFGGERRLLGLKGAEDIVDQCAGVGTHPGTNLLFHEGFHFFGERDRHGWSVGAGLWSQSGAGMS